jgi:DNA-binding Xre family transcriptional regulator
MYINTRKIRVALAEKGMTQANLSQKSGISKQNLSIILKKGRCHEITAGKIASALGIQVEQIMEVS